MRDLQNSRVRRSKFRQNRAFDVAADVAGEQQRDVAIDHLDDDRIVVPHFLPFPVGRGRMQDEDARSGDAELLSFASICEHGTKIRGPFEYRMKRDPMSKPPPPKGLPPVSISTACDVRSAAVRRSGSPGICNSIASPCPTSSMVNRTPDRSVRRGAPETMTS